MLRNRRKARIVSDPEIMSGIPVVAGTRVPAENILLEVRSHTPRVDIFMSYPTIPPDAIDACLEWEKAGKPL